MSTHNRWFRPGVRNEGSDFAVHDQTEDFGGPESYPRPWADTRRERVGHPDAHARVSPAAYGIADDDGLRAAPGRASWHRAADVNWQDRHEDGALRHRPGVGGRPAGVPRESERGYDDAPYRSRPLWPKGYERADARICDDVCERLADDARLDLREVEVNVAGGVATLTGEACDRNQKLRIEEIADHVAGVKDVDNRLRVRTSRSE